MPDFCLKPGGLRFKSHFPGLFADTVPGKPDMHVGALNFPGGYDIAKETMRGTFLLQLSCPCRQVAEAAETDCVTSSTRVATLPLQMYADMNLLANEWRTKRPPYLPAAVPCGSIGCLLQPKNK
eukprot:1148980-Pelagomonas_calceolata.AAC.4